MTGGCTEGAKRSPRALGIGQYRGPPRNPPVRMIRPLVLLATLILFLASAARADDFDEAAFDARFRQLLDEAGIPGGAYAIVRNGHIVRAVGHGVRMSGGAEPVTPETVFRVASVSKTFAAVLTAQLVGEGRLHWDDPVAKFLPDFRLRPADAMQRMQLQHLLGQSTGVVPNAYDNLIDVDTPLERVLPRFRELEPSCAPGRCYTYQNILFGLIDPVIRQATGRDYSALVQERLFVPLGMRQASLGMDAFLGASNRARPHIRRNGVWIPTEVTPGYYQLAPAAGVNASVLDMGQWLLAQLGAYPEALSPQQVEAVIARRVHTARDLRRRHWRDLLSDAHYGLGWRIYRIGEEEIYGHSGWVKGFVADIAYSRSRGVGLAVLLNAESSVINEISTTFWAQTLGAERGAP